MKNGLNHILYFLLIVSCRKDISPENPCNSAQEVKADFVIEELVGDRYFEGDTIDGFNKIRFRALQQADSYEWILGAETLRTQSFIRTQFPDGWLDVSLTIKRKPNKLCFPFDDGIASSYRLFYCWPPYTNQTNTPPNGPYYPIYGHYRGYNLSNPSFLFTVSLLDTFWLNESKKPAYVGVFNGIPHYYINLRSVCESCGIGSFADAASPKALRLKCDGLGGGKFGMRIPVMGGYVWLDRANTDKIVIEYSYADTVPYSSVLKHNDMFIGYRIK